jgi:hypothetical protein
VLTLAAVPGAGIIAGAESQRPVAPLLHNHTLLRFLMPSFEGALLAHLTFSSSNKDESPDTSMDRDVVLEGTAPSFFSLEAFPAAALETDHDPIAELGVFSNASSGCLQEAWGVRQWNNSVFSGAAAARPHFRAHASAASNAFTALRLRGVNFGSGQWSGSRVIALPAVDARARRL